MYEKPSHVEKVSQQKDTNDIKLGESVVLQLLLYVVLSVSTKKLAEDGVSTNRELASFFSETTVLLKHGLFKVNTSPMVLYYD